MEALPRTQEGLLRLSMGELFLAVTKLSPNDTSCNMPEDTPAMKEERRRLSSVLDKLMNLHQESLRLTSAIRDAGNRAEQSKKAQSAAQTDLAASQQRINDMEQNQGGSDSSRQDMSQEQQNAGNLAETAKREENAAFRNEGNLIGFLKRRDDVVKDYNKLIAGRNWAQAALMAFDQPFLDYLITSGAFSRFPTLQSTVSNSVSLGQYGIIGRLLETGAGLSTDSSGSYSSLALAEIFGEAHIVHQLRAAGAAFQTPASRETFPDKLRLLENQYARVSSFYRTVYGSRDGDPYLKNMMVFLRCRIDNLRSGPDPNVIRPM
jgi:hypothetical protein